MDAVKKELVLSCQAHFAMLVAIPERLVDVLEDLFPDDAAWLAESGMFGAADDGDVGIVVDDEGVRADVGSGGQRGVETEAHHVDQGLRPGVKGAELSLTPVELAHSIAHLSAAVCNASKARQLRPVLWRWFTLRGGRHRSECGVCACCLCT